MRLLSRPSFGTLTRWETGKITIDKVIMGAWLHVTDLHGVIQTTINRQAPGWVLEWPSNILSSEIWVQLIEDKGGTATKLLLSTTCRTRHCGASRTCRRVCGGGPA